MNEPLRSTWPLVRRDWTRLLAMLVAVIGAGAVLGLLLTRWTDPNAITEADRRLAEWFAAHRTEGRTDLAAVGARLADTEVKIAITAIVAGLMVWRWKRWHEALFVALSLIFEATAFITITAIVQRPRPAVDRLLDSPVDSSFPSGHVAAATVYAAFAMVVFWRTRAVWARALAVAAVAVVPVAVGVSRMYQGMHFLSDVLAGVVLGAVTLVICRAVLGAPAGAVDARSSAPPQPLAAPPPVDSGVEIGVVGP